MGDSVGGSHISALLLIKSLPAEHYNVMVVLHEDGPLVSYLKQQGVSYQLLDNSPVIGHQGLLLQVANMFRLSMKLAGFIRKNGIELVHTNDLRMHLTWSLATRLAGSRFVWHQRTADDSRRNGWYSLLANKIITISEFCKSRLPARMKTRSEVIYDPFEVPDIKRQLCRDALIQEFNLPDPDQIVIFVGHFTQQKRPDVFIRAARRIREQSSFKIAFVMIGEDRSDENNVEINSARKRHLDNDLIMPGARYPSINYIAGCDIIVAPAVNEGLGRTLIEAMQAGTVVVASNHGGHAEVINDGINGFLFPLDNDEQLANTVLSVMNNPETKNVIRNASEDVEQTFSVSGHSNQIQNIYDSIL